VRPIFAGLLLVLRQYKTVKLAKINERSGVSAKLTLDSPRDFGMNESFLFLSLHLSLRQHSPTTMVLSLRTRKDELSIAFLEDTLYLAPPTPAFGSSSTPPSTPASTSNAPSRSPSEEHLPEENLNAPQSEPSNDPILRGQVTLINHAPRKAKKIRVQLVGRSAAHGGDGSTSYEATNTLEKTLEIDLKGERLEKGTHT